MSTPPSSATARPTIALTESSEPVSHAMATTRLPVSAVSPACSRFQIDRVARDDGDSHALAGELSCNCFANATAAAGHDGGLSSQLQVHGLRVSHMVC